ncbi:MAG: DUF512 domain-containing protein [Candidatus Cloacimonadales bacterium]
MPLKIDFVQPESWAEKLGIQSEDILLQINDHAINDFLDLQFYAADQKLKLQLLRAGEILHFEFEQDWQTPLGLEPAPLKCRLCANNCIFCFVDQMRPDIRHSLYIKDDDYRLSFVFGNFITMTNLTEADFDKIIEQQLSPLYVSVQATNPLLRQKLLRHKHKFDLIEKLQKLSRAGIEFHTQIVVIPGWNDQAELQRSLRDLSDPRLNVLSIGIVPIGLTKYRENLTPLRNVTAAEAKQVLAAAADFPKALCSDEFYLLAGTEVPPEEYYGSFDQLENGIGMVRLFWQNWQDNREEFIEYLQQKSQKYLFICGELSQTIIRKLSQEINQILPDKTRVAVIKNNFLGPTVTVTGLLAAKDILAQTALSSQEIPVLSRGMFNDDLMTIDNLSLTELSQKFGQAILLIDEEFANWQIKT